MHEDVRPLAVHEDRPGGEGVVVADDVRQLGVLLPAHVHPPATSNKLEGLNIWYFYTKQVRRRSPDRGAPMGVRPCITTNTALGVSKVFNRKERT